MKLELTRHYFGDTFTVGALYIDGRFSCYTIEDKVREPMLSDRPVSEWKIPGETAIPRGTYKVTLTMSNRFGKVMPLLNDVPGYEGVRIHTGNTDKDTEGCLIVGSTWDGRSDFIGGSKAAYERLYAALEGAVDEITIRIS